MANEFLQKNLEEMNFKLIVEKNQIDYILNNSK